MKKIMMITIIVIVMALLLASCQSRNFSIVYIDGVRYLTTLTEDGEVIVGNITYDGQTNFWPEEDWTVYSK